MAVRKIVRIFVNKEFDSLLFHLIESIFITKFLIDFYKNRNLLFSKISDNKVDFQRLQNKSFSIPATNTYFKKETMFNNCYVAIAVNKISFVIVKQLCYKHKKY